MPVAAVAVKDAGTFKLAFGPKMMPAGLIRNRLELPPVTWIKPPIAEGLPPVTLPKILRILGWEIKLAIWSGLRPNLRKEWKRFAPSLEVEPPVMLKRLPSGVTAVPVPSLAGTTSELFGCVWALAGSAVAAQQKVKSINSKIK